MRTLFVHIIMSSVRYKFIHVLLLARIASIAPSNVRCELLLHALTLAWSACLSVCWSRPWAIKDWINWDAFLGAESRGFKELCIRWDTYGRHLVNTIETSVGGGDAACRWHTVSACSSCSSVLLLFVVVLYPRHIEGMGKNKEEKETGKAKDSKKDPICYYSLTSTSVFCRIQIGDYLSA